MGLLMSLAGKGLPTTQLIDKMKERFQDLFGKNIGDFDQFHLAILDMFVTANSVLPGKHWVVPPLDEITRCYEKIQHENDEESKKLEVINFLKENIQPNKLDTSLLIIGLATPPAAMAAKKSGEGVPQLKFIKSVPDVVFVPAATLLALVSVKLSRRLFLQQAVAEDQSASE